MDQVLSTVTERAGGFSSSCSVPGLPDFIVGLDFHLQEVKRLLLKDTNQVLTVSAPGGCGKTTLAKMLCHDNEIKDAKNQLENMMSQMGSEKILLVLDDLWCESQSIIQHLKFPIPGYKILVTSRFLFSSFGSTYELGLLNDEDARTLLYHSAFPCDGSRINEKIAASALLDLWVELYDLDTEGMYTSEYLLELSSRNLLNLIVARKDASEPEGYCNDHYVMQHDLLRDLAIHLSSQEPIPQRKRMLIEIHANDIPTWWIEQTQQPISARLLSVTTDETFSTDWNDLKAPKVEVLKLSFIMCEIGHAFESFSINSPPMLLLNLTELEIDRCYDLKQVPASICDLVHLEKLSITNCHELEALPIVLGSLSKLEILRLHSCTRLAKLPESIGNLHNLVFLDISDCLSINSLPDQIGELNGLRVLKMSGCHGLEELPASVTNLLCDEETSYLWRYYESDLCDLKINVVGDDRLANFMKIVG
ncbi:hypothetical protein L1987_44137 [Smallanthus sonchifolius]|uniref:Uncharacterized protein n=1 Tax=Smallanthus sonchifolius TaxID=185202 RepID=A0ACB9GPN8_9ASTR|nr:hypothetical protein L1987_44137 [Smallanthus sonchifolius]